MKLSILALLVCLSLAQGFQSHWLSDDIITTFITNGHRANRQQFPHQAAIWIGTQDGRSGFCGGSLIADEWVLTAAHCVHTMKNFTIILGAHHLSDTEEEGRQSFQVGAENAVTHPGWDMIGVKNDIALIRLPTKAILNEYVQVINLPKRGDANSQEQSGLLTTVSGWGRESDSSKSVAEYLQYIDQPLISNLKCAFYYLFQIRAGHVCTSGAKKMSTCQGDSGGPLLVRNYETDEVKQIGIVSFGIMFGCEKGWPPVFTRISYYLDFIEEVTGLDLN